MGKHNLVYGLGVVGLVMGWGGAAWVPAASFQTFNVGISGVSPDGSVVVGPDRSAPFGQAVYIPVGGPVTNIGCLPGGYQSAAFDASTGGAVIVGKSGTYNAGQRTMAFRWTIQAGMVALGLLPGRELDNEQYATGVSNDGAVVVGFSRRYFPEYGPAVNAASNSETDSSQQGTAFRWTQQDGMVDLGCLAGDSYSEAHGVSGEGCVIVGTSSTGANQAGHAFRWTQATGMVGPGDGTAQAVSADGRVIVGSSGDRAVKWTEQGGMVSLGSIPWPWGAYSTAASAVSGDGSVIAGTYQLNGYIPMAFIWDSQHAMRDLRTVLTDDYGLDMSACYLQYVTGISDDGTTLVGSGRDIQGHTIGWVAVIPEPGSLLLMAVALAGLRILEARRGPDGFGGGMGNSDCPCLLRM